MCLCRTFDGLSAARAAPVTSAALTPLLPTPPACLPSRSLCAPAGHGPRARADRHCGGRAVRCGPPGGPAQPAEPGLRHCGGGIRRPQGAQGGWVVEHTEQLGGLLLHASGMSCSWRAAATHRVLAVTQSQRRCRSAASPANRAPLPCPCQVYELKKDEIDGALDKARAQVTALNDKYLSKVRRPWLAAPLRWSSGLRNYSVVWALRSMTRRRCQWCWFVSRSGRPSRWACPRHTSSSLFVVAAISLQLNCPPASSCPSLPCIPSSQVMAKIPRHTPAKPAESSSERKEE